MPGQTQDSYWSCDYCGAGGFRSMDEAKAHETDCLSRKRPRVDRRIVLLEQGVQHNLDSVDAVACQSLELFEANQEAAANQLGLQCVYCVHRSPPQAVLFPEGVDAIASNVRMLADQHVRTCPMAPPGAREALSQSSSHAGPLEEYCDLFCRRHGIADRFPLKSGICFGDGGMMMQPPMDTTIAATPLARRSKEQPPSAYEDPAYSGGYPQEHQYGEQLQHNMPYGGGHDPHTTPGHATVGSLEGSESQHGTPQDVTPHNPGGGYPMHPGQPSSYDAPHQQHMQQPPPHSLPFYQDHNGAWVCRYCISLHPQYRDQGSVWHAPNHSPPPASYIDQHLSMCRSYNQSMPQHPPMAPHQQGQQWGNQPPPPSYYQQHGMPPQPPQYGPPGGWNAPMSSFSGGATDQQGGYPYPEHGGMPPPHEHARGPHQLGPPPSTPRTPAPPSDASLRAAIDHLVVSERNLAQDSEEQLTLEEDKLLLTDYFYHLMKQLRVCRFSEKDRKTRGGKRENIKVGYGGLQCVHCVDAPNARKFYWSNVDRLANSFAEIPGHVLKCRRCPTPTKNALAELKLKHPEQMARLPRGSQKVFFRRMWRRLHDGDADAGGVDQKPPATVASIMAQAQIPSPEHSKESGSDKNDIPSVEATHSSPGTSGDDSSIVVQRSTAEAAKALAASMTDPPSPSSRILLSIPEDKEWLSDMDCFIRRNMEVFCASEEDVGIAHADRKYPVSVGQCGIRCIHCAMAKTGEAARGSAVAYPYSISGIYESVREFHKLHLESCPNLPENVKEKLAGLKGSTSLTSVLRKYYVLASKALGMYDTADGIRAGAESAPVGPSAAFAFSESQVSQQMRAGMTPGGGGVGFMESGGPMITPLESRKRKNPPMSGGGDPAKQQRKDEADT